MAPTDLPTLCETSPLLVLRQGKRAFQHRDSVWVVEVDQGSIVRAQGLDSSIP